MPKADSGQLRKLSIFSSFGFKQLGANLLRCVEPNGNFGFDVYIIIYSCFSRRFLTEWNVVQGISIRRVGCSGVRTAVPRSLRPCAKPIRWRTQ